MNEVHVEAVAQRIRMEFAEMPGLYLTSWQAQRLWNLPGDMCDRALSSLLQAGVLVRTSDGRFRQPHPERSAAEATRRRT
jgi:hypothetical protein